MPACCTPTSRTVAGDGLHAYAEEPWLDGAAPGLAPSRGQERRRRTSCALPRSRSAATGGLQLLTGNLGRAVIKISAVKPEHRVVEAPAIVFDDQEQVMAAFEPANSSVISSR